MLVGPLLVRHPQVNLQRLIRAKFSALVELLDGSLRSLKVLVQHHRRLVVAVGLPDQSRVQNFTSLFELLAQLLLRHIHRQVIHKDVVVECFLHVLGNARQPTPLLKRGIFLLVNESLYE